MEEKDIILISTLAILIPVLALLGWFIRVQNKRMKEAEMPQHDQIQLRMLQMEANELQTQLDIKRGKELTLNQNEHGTTDNVLS